MIGSKFKKQCCVVELLVAEYYITFNLNFHILFFDESTFF